MTDISFLAKPYKDATTISQLHEFWDASKLKQNLEACAAVQMVREISSQHEQHRENKHLQFSATEQKEFQLSGPLTVTAADTKSVVIKTEASRFTSSHC